MRCCVPTRAQAVNPNPFVFTRQNLKVFHVPQFLAGSLARRTGPDSELGAFFPASTMHCRRISSGRGIFSTISDAFSELFGTMLQRDLRFNVLARQK